MMSRLDELAHPAALRGASRIGRGARFARVVVLVGLGFAGCGGSPPVATAADAARANLQLADLEQGRTLLIAKCGGCHRAPMPSDHVAADWPHAVDEMAVRAKLDATQHHLIAQYLVTMTTHR